jgi:hypothetical protein
MLANASKTLATKAIDMRNGHESVSSKPVCFCLVC